MNNTLAIASVTISAPHSLDGLDDRELIDAPTDARQDLPPIMLYRMREHGTAVETADRCDTKARNAGPTVCCRDGWMMAMRAGRLMAIAGMRARC